MNHNHQHDQQPGQMTAPPFWRSRDAIGLVVFGAIALYFLMSEHRAHFISALPFLLLLACPLMHIFMHGGHGRYGGDQAIRIGDEMGDKNSTAPQTAKTGEQA